MGVKAFLGGFDQLKGSFQCGAGKVCDGVYE